MADYIDREAELDAISDIRKNLIRKLQMLDDTRMADAVIHGIRLVEESIEKAQSADVVEARHGRWIVRPLWEGAEGGYADCSECNKPAWWKSDYCPNCGARMDGGEYKPDDYWETVASGDDV